MNEKPEKIKVIFNEKTWEFDYYEDLTTDHFRKTLSQIAPEIVNASAEERIEENGKTKVIEFKKQIKYKG